MIEDPGGVALVPVLLQDVELGQEQPPVIRNESAVSHRCRSLAEHKVRVSAVVHLVPQGLEGLVLLQHVEDLPVGDHPLIGLAPDGESHGGDLTEVLVAVDGRHGESLPALVHLDRVVPEALLEVDPVPHILARIVGVEDAVHGQIDGRFHGIMQRKAGFAGSDESGTEDITGSMIVSGDLGSHYLPGLPCLVILVYRSDATLLVAYPRENDALRSERFGVLEHLLDVSAGVGSGFPFQSEHQAELCEIRHEDVRLLAEPPHPGREVGSEHPVELSFVGHDGIHVHRRAVMGQLLHQVAYDVDLLEGSQESRVECIECDIQCLPVLHYRDHVLGQVAICESLESAGMGREDGRGKAGALDTRGGDDR